MDEISTFVHQLAQIIPSGALSIEEARQVVKQINEFLYTNYDGIGRTEILGKEFDYLSDFHKYWEKHHKEILNCHIDEDRCKKVAEALHGIYLLTSGKAFQDVWNTCHLENDEVCKIRFLTANQDFRGSLKFDKLAEKYTEDPSLFDVENIANNPNDFLSEIGLLEKSQGDKRKNYAQRIAKFVVDRRTEPIGLIGVFDNDIYKLREAIISCEGAGYGRKKTDMFLRDMVVLGIWNNVSGFEKIDVASDVNTMQVALRTGIIKTAIPLVSSFLDIFCYQYSYIEEMNAKAWRRVWEIWCDTYPTESLESPCLMDYFVYNVVGKQFCKESLAIFKGVDCEHTFRWHSGANRTCQICYRNNIKGKKAQLIRKVMPCSDEEGYIAIRQSAFAKSIAPLKIDACPFKEICKETKYLQPPKSISIFGQTGWTDAYTERGHGGGGLMA